LSWQEVEYASYSPRDIRLKKRVIELSTDFYKHPEANIPQACGSRAKTKAAYRFLEHSDIDLDNMLDPHYQATQLRIKKEKVVLGIQDTTSLNYSGHANDELGALARKSTGAHGIILHDTLALTPEGVPLGLIDIQTWCRKKERGLRDKRKIAIEDKESIKWLKSYDALKNVQKVCKNTLCVSVGDRESDVFDLFEHVRKEDSDPHLLIRASRNRCLEEKGEHLWDTLKNQLIAGQVEITVPRKPGKKQRTATLSIQYKQVEIRATNGRKTTVKLWAVFGNELAPPEGETPISWMLLTTLPVLSFDDAEEKLKWYVIRWQIEVYHKIIKTGCGVERRQLNNLKKLEACIAIDLVVAWRIFFLTKYSREYPNEPCTINFEDDEWQALYIFVNQTQNLPKTPPSIKEAVHMLASMGGFLGRKSDGHPGPITIRRGLTQLSTIIKTLAILKPRGQPIYG